MARTYTHRPRWVQATARPDLAREHHDHCNGICDLLGAEDPFTGGRGACYRYLDWSVRTCSCDLCSGRPYRRAALRRRRAAERTLLRAAARGAEDVEIERLEGVTFRVAASW